MGNACMQSALEAALSGPTGAVKWYPVGGEESKAVIKSQEKKYDEGKKSFLDVAVKVHNFNFLDDKTGNGRGELGGNIVFRKNGTDVQKENYSNQVGTTPTFDLGNGGTVWGVALYDVPLNLMPAGENNMGVCGHGVACPSTRLMHMEVEIDGKPLAKQAFDEKSKEKLDGYMHIFSNRPKITEKAPEGSFYAWNEGDNLRNNCFKFPIIEQLDEATVDSDTCCDGKALMKAWIDAFSELSAGEHTVTIKLYRWYDWATICFFPFKFQQEFGTEKDFKKLSEKPPNPMEPTKVEDPVAVGSFKVKVPDNYKEVVSELADPKPPAEGYFRDDKEEIRKQCAAIAAGQVKSPPDYTIIMTDLTQEGRWENNSNYKYSYDYIEYAACYLNKDKKDDPEAEGEFWVGAMVRGETVPRKITKNWVFQNCYRLGGIMTFHKSPTKNKYILGAMGKC